jgi:hypothetical protein
MQGTPSQEAKCKQQYSEESHAFNIRSTLISKVERSTRIRQRIIGRVHSSCGQIHVDGNSAEFRCGVILIYKKGNDHIYVKLTQSSIA